MDEKELWWEVLRETFSHLIGSSEKNTNASDNLTLQIQGIPQGESAKIIEELMMEGFENPNPPITRPGYSRMTAYELQRYVKKGVRPDR